MAHLASRMARFNSIRREYALSDDQIRAVAPSIFATDAHASRSERYAYIPTSQVLDGLRNEGFQPFAVAQSRTRIADRREHTRHMIRLRHVGDISKGDSMFGKGEAAHEIVLLNSHDGTSSYQMLNGMFRFVCANGLVCGDVYNDIRIRHKGDVSDNVIQGAYTVLETAKRLEADMEEMQSIELNNGEQLALANAALVARFGTAGAPIEASQLLTARRFDDRAGNLWTTFNRIQENATQGGMTGRDANGRARKVRAVEGMDQSNRLNAALWTLAESMKALKA